MCFHCSVFAAENEAGTNCFVQIAGLLPQTPTALTTYMDTTTANALLADARKCVSLVNANGYYDNWLARCARVIERSAP